VADLPEHVPDQMTFGQIAELIAERKGRALQAVNTELIELYWQVGKIINEKVKTANWGKKVVEQLADYLKKSQPGLKGFTRRNLYRMRQFYECYEGDEIVSPLVSQLPWTHHLIIIGQCKLEEERLFYLQLAVKERWSSRELERQLKGALFERNVLSKQIVSAVPTQLPKEALNVFKDSYMLEFLNLGEEHSEADLHGGLLANLRKFLTELGRDFCFIGSEHPLQVGGQDFALDLLFFHRELNCLVAIELKVGRFEPEHLGKLNFYLESLDRDVRKGHENPSIGLLLCASKDDEVVKYAMGRSLSPTMISEYETQLPDKKLLQAKLHEFMLAVKMEETDSEEKK
jgi:predicted nuclease of restriction endonuclease-like (RecB) superfamily